MPFGFSVRALTFNDGTRVELEPNDIVVIVGPNNAGKTSCLREIVSVAKGDRGVIVSSVDSHREGDANELLDWLRSHCKISNPGGAQQHLTGWQAQLHESNAQPLWNSSTLSDLVSFLFRFVDAETRLRASNATENVDLRTEPVSNTLHATYEKKELEDRIAAAFKRAFGVPLFLDLWSGRTIGFRIGRRPDAEPRTEIWREEIGRNSPLQDQGDGMRSFVGCLLEIMTTPHPVLLIDEPELFLHSPQALQLGRLLARDKPQGRQLILATHSAEVLRGLLNANVGTLRVLRVRRENEFNPISQLNPIQVRTLWADPLLRVSNLLDGLFHEAVFVCEGDADSRFYAAVLDALSDMSPENARPDIMFVHTGGKHRISMVLRALAQAHVPVRAIADFDVLREETTIKAIFEALGGEFSTIRNDWQIVHRAMDEKSPPLSLQQVKDQIGGILDAETGPYLTEKSTEAIRAQLKAVSAWTDAKRTGSRALPSGHPTNAYVRLNQQLRTAGLFLVEVGELERFAPSIGKEGPSWVNEVLQRDLKADIELADARLFVQAIVDSLQPSDQNAPKNLVPVVVPVEQSKPA